MQHVLAHLNLYPDGNAFYLKHKLADKLTVQPGNLILGNGSNEIIEFVGHAFMEPGVDVVLFGTGDQAHLRSNIEWSATIRYVSLVATLNTPAYVGGDTTLRWRPRDELELSVTGQNLLRPRHQEFADVARILLPTAVQRSVFVKMAWSF